APTHAVRAARTGPRQGARQGPRGQEAPAVARFPSPERSPSRPGFSRPAAFRRDPAMRLLLVGLSVALFTPASPAAAPAAPPTVSSRTHSLPVLARAVCTSGACHGALAGKGGLKLSLRGYDPAADHFVLTRQALGRRIDREAPAKSLFLLKPT